MTLRSLNYGNCCIFRILGNPGFISSTVGLTLGLPLVSSREVSQIASLLRRATTRAALATRIWFWGTFWQNDEEEVSRKACLATPTPEIRGCLL